MAYESSAIVGSGLNPLKKDDCLLNPITGERHLRGTNVNLVNPEDASAGCSGLVTQLNVGTTAVKLPTAPLKYRRGIAIFNNDNNRDLYIGFDSGVTTGTGWPIPAGTSLPMDINGDIEVWGVSTQNIDVRILELA